MPFEARARNASLHAAVLLNQLMQNGPLFGQNQSHQFFFKIDYEKTRLQSTIVSFDDILFRHTLYSSFRSQLAWIIHWRNSNFATQIYRTTTVDVCLCVWKANAINVHWNMFCALVCNCHSIERNQSGKNRPKPCIFTSALKFIAFSF